MIKKYKYYIGIDTGTNTGFALWDAKEKNFKHIETMKIHEAMLQISALSNDELAMTMIRVEDARQRKWFGQSGREKLQGAGSVKRDATIWEDFLKDLKANFEMVAPKNNVTKLTADSFKKITGWPEKTNVHCRDA
jgi:hypothetical protein